VLLLDLASRCEAATGPDREIDCLIHEWRFTELTPAMRGMYYGEPTGEYFRDGGETTFRAPAYTASLDAAMSLVPEGWARWIYDADEWRCICRLEDDNDREVGANAATWPLAITAAALRARGEGSLHG
jgi:hypothetical protein